MTRLFLTLSMLVAFSLSFIDTHLAAQTLTTLHAFPEFPSDGLGPTGTLILSGSTLYGTTSEDGTNFKGTVFSMNTDGSNYRVLQTFNGANGAVPLGGLTLVDSTLYGTTSHGGPQDAGTIFSLQTNGTGFRTLQSFNGSDGSAPYATMILSGSTLYGTTEGGGVFRMETDGSGFRNIAPFASTGRLAIDASTLYGTTISDGTLGGGSIFSVQTDGSDPHTLYSFGTGGARRHPYGGVTIVGSTIYGTTGTGPSSVFSINIDGTDYGTLHSFSGLDGSMPYSDDTLVASNGKLYGTTYHGGPNDSGVVFSMNLDGTDFQRLAFFGGSNGGLPVGGVVLGGSTLYGTTSGTGPNGNGTVFAVNGVPEPSSFAILAIGAFGLGIRAVRRNCMRKAVADI